MTSYQSVIFKVDQVHPYTTKAPTASAVKHHLHRPSSSHPPKKLTIHHVPPIQDPSQVISTQENLANQLAMLSVKRAVVFQDHHPTTNQPKTSGFFWVFFQKKKRVSVWCLVNLQDLDDRPIFRDFDRSASRMSRFSTKSRTLTTWSTRENAAGSTAVAAEVGIFSGEGGPDRPKEI